MAIEKTLYEMPQGVSEAPELEVEIEIEQENDEEPTVEVEVKEAGFNENLAEEMDEGTLQAISEEILDFIKTDISSRKEWESPSQSTHPAKARIR